MHENNSKQDIKVKENKKPDIKIFVSHRIDLDSETIDNPLYVNVRCGAVFDKRENIDMLGDNTGDNISEKRESFNESTVMYWAWKNVEADYYGLFHYRRYFSFSGEKPKEVNAVGVYCEKYLSNKSINKYQLNNIEIMTNMISQYDGIYMEPVDVQKVLTPKGYKKNVKDHFISYDVFIEAKYIDLALEYIKEKYPKIYPYAINYLNKPKHIGYNVFILKKELFFEYCTFLFDILNHNEKKTLIDSEYYCPLQYRSPSFLAELLNGIYATYLMEKQYKIKSLPLIFFNNTEKQIIHKHSYPNNIPIVIRINDYYAPYFTVLLQSIIDNANEKNNYDIIVLEHTVTKENKRIISEILQGKNNISVRYFNPEYLLEDVILPFKTELDSIEPYYSIFIPWLLPNYDKVLIIDCDTILLGDIAEIYNQDISDYLAGACKDIMHLGMYNINENGYVDYVKEELKLQKPYEYFNTKIMLLNTDKIRNSFNIKDIFNKVKTNKYNELEQDLFNNLLNGKVKYFDYKYSIISEVDTFINSRIEYAPKKENNAYRKAQANPFVINFNNYPKPWSNPNIPYSYKWWEIARKTPFYEMILYRMTHEQSNHISFTKLDHFSRIMFPLRWLKKIHKIGYIRQIADKLLPHGTKRRKIVKKILFK